MAIKFVDQEPDDGGKPKKVAAKPVPSDHLKPEPGEPPEETGALPGLPYAKPEPKKRGRKKTF